MTRNEFPILSKLKESKRGLLISQETAEILLTLYRTHGRQLDARNIAIAVQKSVNSVLKRLVRLEDMGLVQVQRVGRSVYWNLNTEHELWSAIKKLIYAEHD